MNRTVKIIPALMACLMLAFFIAVNGCSKIHAAHTCTTVAADSNEAILLNKQKVDTAISRLRSGDIVLRRGIGADSYLLAMMNQKDKTYSHCGIVMIENGYPFIYHSIGGEDNPDERLRRDSAAFFFSPLHNTHIAIVRYDYENNITDSLGEIVRLYYQKRPKFDMKFDLASDDKLYCSEFVYKAVNKATGDNAYISTSFIKGKPYVGIDDLFLNRHAHVVWQTKFKQYICNTK